MAKKIYPGNWVTQLSSYQGQPVVAVPGRTYHHVVGFATITSTGATSWDVTIPSPDMRGDDKPRPDITGLIVPVGANVYHVGIRVCDTRKDRGVGTATTGLTGAQNNRIKAASALGSSTDNTIAATKLSTNSADLSIGANLTVAPTGGTVGVVTPVAVTGSALTLKVYSTDATGAAAGSNITSSATGGTPVIVEVAYYTEDVCPDMDGTFIPFITET
jgi:hypothetical protein